ncbi:hypothetical protein EON67_02230, partial [archaeon]
MHVPPPSRRPSLSTFSLRLPPLLVRALQVMSAGAASIPASPLASPLASPGQISSGLIVIPTVPMRFARWLPAWYARRATVWIPNHVRAARNWALYFTFAEVFVSLVCCG